MNKQITINTLIEMLQVCEGDMTIQIETTRGGKYKVGHEAIILRKEQQKQLLSELKELKLIESAELIKEEMGG